jgi:hypothetical protein
LCLASLLPEIEDEPPELGRFRFWMEMAYHGQRPGETADQLYQSIVWDKDFGPVNKQLVSSLEFLRDRIHSGGMLNDRLSCLAAMFLFGYRKVNVADIEHTLAEHIEERKAKESRIRIVNLPWHVFDPSTRVGIEAMDFFIRQWGVHFRIDIKTLERLWYLMSYVSPGSNYCTAYNGDERLTFLDTCWLPWLLKRRLPYGGLSGREVKQLWEEEISPELEKIVLRRLEIRAEKS